VFAEGSRGGEYFMNFFLLFNPLPSAATVNARFYLPNGAVAYKSYTVPPQGRLTLNANLIPELGGQDFSTAFVSNSPIVAERAMYWGGPNWIGGTASMGSTGGWHTWHFAEGAAQQNFETYYLIQNPNPVPITVRGAFFQEDGYTHIRHFRVTENSRFTISLNQMLGNVGAIAASFDTSPDTPMVVERSIYWGVGRVEGTSSLGMPRAAYEWHLPEGTSGSNFDTFMLMSNPTNTAVVVDITIYVEGLGRFSIPNRLRQVLQPFSRKTLHMNTFLAQLGAIEGIDLSGRSFSTRVRVLNNAAPILVEHAIYWQRDGFNYWRAGAGGFGIPR
jgi:hypothetical protein